MSMSTMDPHPGDPRRREPGPQEAGERSSDRSARDFVAAAPVSDANGRWLWADADSRERLFGARERSGSGSPELRIEGLELTDGLRVDALLSRGADHVAVQVLVASDQDAHDRALGVALRTRAELRRLRAVLGRLCDCAAEVFDDVRMVLIAPRFPDALHAAVAGGLAGIDLLEVSGATVPAEPAEVDPSPPADDPVAESKSSSVAAAAPAPVERPRSSGPVVADRSVPTGQPRRNGRPTERPSDGEDVPAPRIDDEEAPTLARASSHNGRGPADRSVPLAPANLLDEAILRVLRIGDDVEEEVDGHLVRFLVRDDTLAVLTRTDHGVDLYVGDRPETKRSARSLDELSHSLDAVIQRYLQLSNRAETA